MIGNIFHKIISTALIFTFVFSSTFLVKPPRAEAIFGIGDVVFDPTNTVQNTVTAGAATVSASTGTVSSIAQYAIQYKEFVLDGLVSYIMKAVLRQLTTSIVTWINTGFEGSPSFVTDPAGFFTNIASEEIGKFIEGSSDLNFLCKEFSIDLRISLAFQYSPFKKRVTCTFLDAPNGKKGILSNVKGAVNNISINDNRPFTKGNFKNGGWNSWLSLTTQPQNNVYGATLMAQNQLSLIINQKIVLGKDELGQGRGFLSWKSDCTGKSSPEASRIRDNLEYAKTSGDKEEQARQKSLLKAEEKTGCKINTPGSVIEGQLGKVMGSSIDNLGLADEFNEIVNALFAQLVTQVVGGGGGLKGASDTQYDGSSYLDKLGTAQDADTLKNIDAKGKQGVEKSLITVGKFKTEKEGTLSAIVNAESKLNQLASCYTNKIILTQTPPLSSSDIAEATIRSANARTKIQTDIDKPKSDIMNDVSSADTVLRKLKQIQTRISSTESLQDTLAATTEYQTMATNDGPGKIYNELDIGEAKQQKTAISATMDALNVDTSAKLIECQYFPNNINDLNNTNPPQGQV
jgi:hypothetical protein